MLDHEDVASLREEIADSLDTLAEVLARLQAQADSGEHDEAHDGYRACLRNVGMGARLVGLDGLAEASVVLEHSLDDLRSPDEGARTALCALLRQWPQLFLTYLASPQDAGAAGAILRYLRDPGWATALDGAAAEQLEHLFARAYTNTDALPPERSQNPSEAAHEPSLPTSAAESAPLTPAEVNEGADEYTEMGEPQTFEPAAVPVRATSKTGDTEEDSLFSQGLPGEASIPALSASEPEVTPTQEQSSQPDTTDASALADTETPVGTSVLAGEEQLENIDLASGQRSRASAEDEAALAAFSGEIADVRGELDQALTALLSADSGDPALAAALEQHEAIVERLWSTSELLGLAGLQEVCGFISTNLLELAGQDRSARATLRGQLSAWPDLVLSYLRRPADDSTCKALVAHLQNARWPAPLCDEAARELLRKLVQRGARPQVETTEEERPTEARAEDVSLTLPEDANQELLEVFLQEAPVHATEFSACLQKVYDGIASKDDIKLAQRLAHTLKGSAHLTGIRGIATLTHHIEDILEFLAEHPVSPPRQLVNTLVEAADCLETMIDALTQNEPTPANALSMLQEVLNWANRVDRRAFREDDIATERAVPLLGASSPAHAAAENAEGASRRAQEVVTDPGSAAPQQVLRVPTQSIDELLRLVAELSMSITQIQDRYRVTLQHVRALREQEDLVQTRSFELEDLVDIRGAGVMRGRLRRTGTDDAAFDPLEMNQYNELHSTTLGVMEAANDAREFAGTIQEDLALLEDLFVRQERLNKLLQQAVMSTRMVPVCNIVPRLQRAARQTCRVTGKHAELEVSGEHSQIDGEVLQKLADPLMHILRNAIDHGIETVPERTRQGKPEMGRIELEFARLGNTILVRCRDDGRGLNHESIERLGRERGLVAADEQPNDRDLARLLFTPGFSTHTSATHTSGRGIGLDVVYSAVTAMKGSVEIESPEGGGCEITLRLPVSLITAHVLLVQVEGERYGVPTTNLEQILAAGTGELERTDEGMLLRVGEDAYPVRSLAALLNISQMSAQRDDYERKSMLLVRADAGTIAIAVDRVLDGRDLVIKSMGRYVKNITGVLGASILGDGRVVPVLDIPEMLRTPLRALSAEFAAEQIALDAVAGQRVLVVDDSLSARRTLSQLVRDAGYEALVAKDGLEAVDIIQTTRPHLLLVDLEMPRMNGLELTIHVRAHDETKDIPVIVITSRSTDKHRRQATLAGASAYVTKPFQESELLDLIEATINRY